MDLELSGDNAWMFDLASRYPRRQNAAWARHVRAMAEFDRAVEADIALASKVGKASDPVDASLAIAIDRVRAGRAMDNPQAPVTLASWRAWGR